MFLLYIYINLKNTTIMRNFKNKLGLSIILIMIIFASCNKEDSLNEGSFKLQQITYLKNNTEQFQDASINFNLGDIYASKEFYFMLSNAGDYPITNINIVSSNEQFTISPAQIDTLSSTNNNSFTQAITLGILHGKVLNGVGNAPNLEQGENTATLTITGTTYNGREYIDISFEVTINVVAKIADICVSTSSGAIDMTEYCSFALYTAGLYNFCVNQTDFLTFQNTGNVTLNMNIKYMDTINWNEFQYIETNISPTESYTLDNNSLSSVILSFTGENAVVNQEKYITTDNQGVNYLGIKVNYDE